MDNALSSDKGGEGMTEIYDGARMVHAGKLPTDEADYLKAILFAHCSVAADKAITGPDDPINREGGNREQEAKYTALLGVITAAGLGDEYRQYETERGYGYAGRARDGNGQ